MAVVSNRAGLTAGRVLLRPRFPALQPFCHELAADPSSDGFWTASVPTKSGSGTSTVVEVWTECNEVSQVLDLGGRCSLLTTGTCRSGKLHVSYCAYDFGDSQAGFVTASTKFDWQKCWAPVERYTTKHASVIPGQTSVGKPVPELSRLSFRD